MTARLQGRWSVVSGRVTVFPLGAMAVDHVAAATAQEADAATARAVADRLLPGEAPPALLHSDHLHHGVTLLLGMISLQAATLLAVMAQTGERHR